MHTSKTYFHNIEYFFNLVDIKNLNTKTETLAQYKNPQAQTHTENAQISRIKLKKVIEHKECFEIYILNDY